MQKRYNLNNAIMLNTTGQKYDAVAVQVTHAEIKTHSHQFKHFDFKISLKEGYTVYTICKSGEENILQGLVAVKVSTGFLECANMEVNDFNKRPISLYSNVGKCMVALCCKISLDEGFGGFIAFFAKNHLLGYYLRLGAEIVYGLRMAIDEKAAQKLIDLYFQKS